MESVVEIKLSDDGMSMMILIDKTSKDTELKDVASQIILPQEAATISRIQEKEIQILFSSGIISNVGSLTSFLCQENWALLR